jgi:hypothetical protein
VPAADVCGAKKLATRSIMWATGREIDAVKVLAVLHPSDIVLLAFSSIPSLTIEPDRTIW